MTVAAATTAATAPNTTDAAARNPKKSMGQEDFLKLITVQLANQDPLKPMEDTDFMAQMAQFTSLEQSSQMARDLVSLRADFARQSAASLLGREATVSTADGELTGPVESVDYTLDTTRVTIGGVTYPLDRVVRVAPLPLPAAEPSA